MLTGKRALITGGSSGIGRAIGTSLVQAGARVAIAARDPVKLKAVALEMRASPFAVELSTTEAAAHLATQVLDLFGGLDILVLSSGFYRSGTLSGLPAGAFAEMLGSNLIGPAALARCLAPTLAAVRGDLLVLNSSIIRAQNTAERAYYSASQHAMKAFTDGLRDEFNEIGVRVTSIIPGSTATPRQERMHRDAGKVYRPDRLLQPADVAAVAIAALSLSHTAEITDVHVRPRYKS